MDTYSSFVAQQTSLLEEIIETLIMLQYITGSDEPFVRFDFCSIKVLNREHYGQNQKHYGWIMGGLWVDYGWIMGGLWVDYGWIMGGLWVV